MEKEKSPTNKKWKLRGSVQPMAKWKHMQQDKFGSGSERATYKRYKYTNNFEETILATVPYLITIAPEWESLIYHL